MGLGPVGVRQALVRQAVRLGWLGMFQFDEEIVNVPRHTDATALANIVPFDVNPCKLVTCHVELHTMKFLAQLQEIIEVFDFHVFDSKVVNYETELDRLPFAVPEPRSECRFVVAFGNKSVESAETAA